MIYVNHRNSTIYEQPTLCISANGQCHNFNTVYCHRIDIVYGIILAYSDSSLKMLLIDLCAI